MLLYLSGTCFEVRLIAGSGSWSFMFQGVYKENSGGRRELGKDDKGLEEKEKTEEITKEQQVFSILLYGVAVLIYNGNLNYCYNNLIYNGGSVTWETT